MTRVSGQLGQADFMVPWTSVQPLILLSLYLSIHTSIICIKCPFLPPFTHPSSPISLPTCTSISLPMHACIHPCIHTYIQPYIYIYIHKSLASYEFYMGGKLNVISLLQGCLYVRYFLTLRFSGAPMNLGEFRVSETSCEMRENWRSLKTHFFLTVPYMRTTFKG